MVYYFRVLDFQTLLNQLLISLKKTCVRDGNLHGLYQSSAHVSAHASTRVSARLYASLTAYPVVG